jgi:hypothetical protein
LGLQSSEAEAVEAVATRLIIYEGSISEPLVEVWPTRIHANISHGDFELCRAIQRIDPKEPMEPDHWDPNGSVLRIWEGEVFMNLNYDTWDISSALVRAKQAAPQLAEKFLELQE